MCVGDEPRDLHRERRRFLAPPEPGESACLLEAVLRPLEAVRARLEERPPFLEKVEGFLRVSAVELDVRKQLVCPRRPVGVLRQTQDLERSTRVLRCRLGISALPVETGLRPEELGANTRIRRAITEGECAAK